MSTVVIGIRKAALTAAGVAGGVVFSDNMAT